MKTRFLNGFMVTLATLCFASDSYSQSGITKVVIIRHGEKPEEGDHLSCQGLNRALQLPSVLYAKFGRPDYTFVPSPSTGKGTSSIRMLETVIPFAVKYNLTINSKYDKEDAKGVAAAITKKSGTILLVWEHKAIPPLVKALGIKEEGLDWKATDFDSIWIITIGKGKPTLSRDQEGLHPSAACK